MRKLAVGSSFDLAAAAKNALCEVGEVMAREATLISEVSEETAI